MGHAAMIGQKLRAMLGGRTKGPTRLFRMEGDSMAPTLRDAERVLVDLEAYLHSEPERGDVVAFQGLPDMPDARQIKRIIGLPGEAVEVRDGSVRVDGGALAEPYALEPPTYSVPRSWVPDGCYFVLGDNRNNSYDSSKWAPPWLAHTAIVGKVSLPG